MSAQIDANLVIDKLSNQIAAQSKSLAMTEALAEQQGKLIQEQTETIARLNEQLAAKPVEGEVIEEPDKKKAK